MNEYFIERFGFIRKAVNQQAKDRPSFLRERCKIATHGAFRNIYDLSGSREEAKKRCGGLSIRAEKLDATFVSYCDRLRIDNDYLVLFKHIAADAWRDFTSTAHAQEVAIENGFAQPATVGSESSICSSTGS